MVRPIMAPIMARPILAAAIMIAATIKGSAGTEPPVLHPANDRNGSCGCFGWKADAKLVSPAEWMKPHGLPLGGLLPPFC
jgi:hypothetical protein